MAIDRSGPSSSPFVAGRPLGGPAARAAWLVLWGSLAYFALQAASRTSQGLHDMISGMAPGEPGWIASIDSNGAGLLAHRGLQASIVLAALLAVIAVGIFLPVPAARTAVALAIVFAAVIWVGGQDFGATFTGSATDLNSGPLLALLAIAHWPRRTTGPRCRAGTSAVANSGARAPAEMVLPHLTGLLHPQTDERTLTWQALPGSRTCSRQS